MDTFGSMGFMLAAGAMSYAAATLLRVKKLEKRPTFELIQPIIGFSIDKVQ